jgi:hypothetical protein
LVFRQNAPLLLVNEGSDTDFDTQRNANSAHAGDCIAIIASGRSSACSLLTPHLAVDKLIAASPRTVIALSHRLHMMQVDASSPRACVDFCFDPAIESVFRRILFLNIAEK